MNQHIDTAILFIFTKINTVILLYNFGQFIQISMYIFSAQKQEQNNVFIYTFLSFYLIQKVFFLNAQIQLLKLIWWEIILIIFLDIIYLEELFYLIGKYQNVAKENIEGIAIGTTLFQLPLFILTTIWIQNRISYLNALLQNMILFSFIFALYMIVLSAMFSFEYYNKRNQIQYYVKPFFLSIIHFSTYVWLISINCKFDNFGFYFLSILLILVINFLLQIQKIMQFNFQGAQKYFVQCSLVFIQLFHVAIDVRLIDKQKIDSTLSMYGIKLFDRMNIFSFTIKIYLLLIFYIQFEFKQNQNQEIYNINIIILILSIISTIILGQSAFINTILSMKLGTTDLEFYNVKTFISNINYNGDNFSLSKQNRLQTVRIFQQTIQDDEKKDLIKYFFFSYNSSQILNINAKRENIQNESAVIFQNYKKIKSQKRQKISFDFEVDADDIINIIGHQKLLPQIEIVTLKLMDRYHNLFKFYSQLAESNIGVIFKTQKDNNQLTTLNKVFFHRVKQVCAQSKAYYKLISEQLLTNPLIIFYDLYESLSV